MIRSLAFWAAVTTVDPGAKGRPPRLRLGRPWPSSWSPLEWAWELPSRQGCLSRTQHAQRGRGLRSTVAHPPARIDCSALPREARCRRARPDGRFDGFATVGDQKGRAPRRLAPRAIVEDRLAVCDFSSVTPRSAVRRRSAISGAWLVARPSQRRRSLPTAEATAARAVRTVGASRAWAKTMTPNGWPASCVPSPRHDGPRRGFADRGGRARPPRRARRRRARCGR